MKKKNLRRIFSVFSAVALSVGAAAMFAGCTTDRPEVTVTYTFLGKDYNVDYTLSRKSKPQTVQHFIELADAGYYDGLCVHDYNNDITALYAGGYYYDEEGELTEKNYFEAVKKLEEEKNIKFTQSVFMSDEARTPLYTVYGEFSDNGSTVEGSSFSHTQGALVMYYTDKENFNGRVTTIRNDAGKDNNGEQYQDNCLYRYNSATSLFYTFTGSGTGYSERAAKYAVFGMAKDYENQLEKGLLKAIADYTEDLEGEDQFTEERTLTINKNEPFALVQNANTKATYKVPVEPITIKTVKVTKY